jgi:ketosteroid isomerase-like protein
VRTVDNATVALEWLQACYCGDAEKLEKLTGDDCTFFLSGEMQGSGWKDRETWFAGWRGALGALPGPLEVKIGEVTSQDDRVCVEAEAHSTLPSGKVYWNQYHFLLRVRDGQVRTLKEYFDTQHVANTFDLSLTDDSGETRASGLDRTTDGYRRDRPGSQAS